MDWSLVDLANDAQDIALGLQALLQDLSDFEDEVLGNISALFALSPELRRLEKALERPKSRRAAAYVTEEVDLLASSLQLTLESIRNFFGQSEYRTLRAWNELGDQFESEGLLLDDRLGEYRQLASSICEYLQGAIAEEDLGDVSSLVKRLRARQAVGSSTSRPTMPARPHLPRHPHYTQPEPCCEYELDSSDYGDFGDTPYPYPPAPEVASPMSPTFSNSSYGTYHSSDASVTDGPPSPSQHWAVRIFDGRHPWTQFSGALGQPTRCLGRDMPEAVNRLYADGFHKVIELPFDNNEAVVRLYWRPSDHRARILFLTIDQLGRRHRHCIPLTALRFIRTGSCLQLCRVNHQDGQLDLWANLRFNGYERMVLFYCAAVAMKRQDSIGTAPNMEDFFQPGEKIEFAGEIEDDHYRHAFRIFRDRASGAVRFEATALRGPMKKTPIWTAFVTAYVGARAWMRRLGPRTVSLSELHPYVFCEGYAPPRGVGGCFELRFGLADDCEGFVRLFHRIPVPR
ncbi:uncharacterized protein K452DRAFT_131776 [Aplosporella prunicola CBS 121167]|uniref:Uncharacterized protein n=1 Tax=Aplosporella prunicola CBS 121167 TaxID=1176127 RepID=A0A6A6BLA9_9PEZI|nr:uncharacterized protein K452DRAFT_131776 [Aplosporella prunicola CBS 121167]KAF2144899.1 hypothetical protein K452DRAFT_131776 [Aplosporella prunicola CBS 121167]